MVSEVFKLGDRITCLPVIHGSGDFALEVRRTLLHDRFDCIAVPLPPSFQERVESAVEQLPAITMVAQAERPRFLSTSDAEYASGWEAGEWRPESEREGDIDDEPLREYSYVPIDPCQPVIAALRSAIQERIPRAFIDLETQRFETYQSVLPDAYALKKVSLDKFAVAMLPSLPPLPRGQPRKRVRTMAFRLRELAERYRNILFACSILEWPWIREACLRDDLAPAEDEVTDEPETYQPDEPTLLFMLGELPFITGIYERARRELEEEENVSVDGVKELLLAARKSYLAEAKKQSRNISPQLLALCMRYIRNLSLIERRLTPDLYSLVIAAQQMAGDRFAIHVAETARRYEYGRDLEHPRAELGVNSGRLPSGDVVRLVSRLPGEPLEWRSLNLKRRPEKMEQEKWFRQWNPYDTVSWPPEDESIERFRTHCFDQARQIMTADLARSEKFTSSIQDGIDIRETLRNWHTGDLYVKNYPPRIGSLDTVVMLFDTPADPRDYPLRMTWYAEHEEESTLALFGTHYLENMVGPGIGQATYGGALFIFPPVLIPNVWSDERLGFALTLEERLLAAACAYSRHRHIVLVSPAPAGAGWRRLARRYGKKWVHLPLSKFSQSTIEKLRIFHVLNGREVRSYAADFLRRD